MRFKAYKIVKEDIYERVTWLQTEFSYNQIEDSGLQKAIQDTLFNFDWSSLPEGIDKNDWEAVSEYLRRNILFSINNINDSDVSKALADIYSGSLNSGELLDAIAKVQEYFGSEHPISVNLQAKVDDTQSLINNVKEKLQDDFDNKVGELTLEELHIAAEQVEVPEGTLLSWDELIAKIKEVQSSTSNIENPISLGYVSPLTYNVWKYKIENSHIFRNVFNINREYINVTTNKFT